MKKAFVLVACGMLIASTVVSVKGAADTTNEKGCTTEKVLRMVPLVTALCGTGLMAVVKGFGLNKGSSVAHLGGHGLFSALLLGIVIASYKSVQAAVKGYHYRTAVHDKERHRLVMTTYLKTAGYATAAALLSCLALCCIDEFSLGNVVRALPKYPRFVVHEILQ